MQTICTGCEKSRAYFFDEMKSLCCKCKFKTEHASQPDWDTEFEQCSDCRMECKEIHLKLRDGLCLRCDNKRKGIDIRDEDEANHYDVLYEILTQFDNIQE